jgi:SAM-dependent methyltransferase
VSWASPTKTTPVVGKDSPASGSPKSPIARRLFPEIGAGGFSRNDHRIIFYTRVNALLEPHMAVLDFGAGRGRFAETEGGYLRRLTDLRGKCRRLVGCDVDPVVAENPLLDEAVIIPADGPLPFPDASFDMIVSYAVIEHLTEPERTARELERVLKPGGWLCCWTPNKWSYFAIAARLVPNRLHAAVLRVVHSGRKEEDVFPTVYRLNTMRALRRHFPTERFAHHSYVFNGPPGYNAERMALARLWQLWARLTPPALGQALHVFLRKRPAR